MDSELRVYSQVNGSGNKRLRVVGPPDREEPDHATLWRDANPASTGALLARVGVTRQKPLQRAYQRDLPNPASHVCHDKFGFEGFGAKWVAGGTKQVPLQVTWV